MWKFNGSTILVANLKVTCGNLRATAGNLSRVDIPHCEHTVDLQSNVSKVHPYLQDMFSLSRPEYLPMHSSDIQPHG
jgi:hypothetical protein